MDNAKKKELIDDYKKKEFTGGIYCIECAPAGKKWIKSTADLASIKSRFDFSISIDSYIEPAMREAWMKYGAKSFSYSVLETLEKEKEKTDKQYADDLSVLLDIYKEKYHS